MDSARGADYSVLIDCPRNRGRCTWGAVLPRRALHWACPQQASFRAHLRPLTAHRLPARCLSCQLPAEPWPVRGTRLCPCAHVPMFPRQQQRKVPRYPVCSCAGPVDAPHARRDTTFDRGGPGILRRLAGWLVQCPGLENSRQGSLKQLAQSALAIAPISTLLRSCPCCPCCPFSVGVKSLCSRPPANISSLFSRSLHHPPAPCDRRPTSVCRASVSKPCGRPKRIEPLSTSCPPVCQPLHGLLLL